MRFHTTFLHEKARQINIFIFKIKKWETQENKIIQWNEFREELKHINRYFPKKIPDQENLGRLFGFLKLPDNLFPEKFYRARINKDNKPYSSNEMKKPPEVKVPNGRANPVGIPYFYIASDIATAIAEVRPYKGETVTIACLTMKSSLSLVDLRNPKQTLSPFEFDDDDLIRLCTDMSYLILLGEELSKPILPSEAELEYLPSQYLCEFVKNIGFHGIIYKSSLAHGDNYAIFDHKRLKCIGTENYKVTDTEVKAEKYKMKD